MLNCGWFGAYFVNHCSNGISSDKAKEKPGKGKQYLSVNNSALKYRTLVASLSHAQKTQSNMYQFSRISKSVVGRNFFLKMNLNPKCFKKKKKVYLPIYYAFTPAQLIY